MDVQPRPRRVDDGHGRLVRHRKRGAIRVGRIESITGDHSNVSRAPAQQRGVDLNAVTRDVHLQRLRQRRPGAIVVKIKLQRQAIGIDALQLIVTVPVTGFGAPTKATLLIDGLCAGTLSEVITLSSTMRTIWTLAVPVVIVTIS